MLINYKALFGQIFLVVSIFRYMFSQDELHIVFAKRAASHTLRLNRGGFHLQFNWIDEHTGNTDWWEWGGKYFSGYSWELSMKILFEIDWKTNLYKNRCLFLN